MNLKKIFFVMCLSALSFCVSAKKDKEVVPPVEDSWNDDKADGNRSLSSSPFLFKDVNCVYVYSEKQLDNLTIGITDMMGNVYHYEVTTVPACTYYAVSIESLPTGQYRFSIYQGSNYVNWIFNK